MHFTAVLPEVDVKYVMEAFSAPLYRGKIGGNHGECWLVGKIMIRPDVALG